MSRTIWWEDNQVKMIDQRILPLHYEILSYADYRDVAEAITDMVVRGAPAIGAAGGYGMALAALQSPCPRPRLASSAIWQPRRRCWMRLGPRRST